MRAVEMILIGLCVATMALIGEVAVVSYVEPAYTSLLTARTVLGFWFAYASVFAVLAVAAWLLGLPLRRWFSEGRGLSLYVLLLCLAIPIVGGPLVVRPGIAELLQRYPYWLVAVGGLLLVCAWLVLVALRGGPRLRRLTTLLGVIALTTVPALVTFAVNQLPPQLFSARGAIDLVLVAFLMGALSLPIIIAIWPAHERPVERRLAAALACLGVIFGLVVLGPADWRGEPEPRAEQSPGSHPSILLLVVDTLRGDFGAPPDAEPIDLPNIDRFARDGIVFERAHSASPWTIPSFGSILSSNYPAIHHAGHIDPELRFKHALNPSIGTLPESLAERGYRSFAVTSNPSLSARYQLGRGFDRYENVMNAQWYHPIAFWIRSTGPGRRVMKPVRSYLPCEIQNERILEAVAERPGRPFFVLAHYMDPHAPYGAPGKFAASGEGEPTIMDHYRSEVRYADYCFGVMLDELKKMGVYDELLMVFTSDHGEELEEQRGGVNHGHGHTLFTEQIVVPLIFKLPGARGAGLRSTTPVSLIDIAPTLLTIVGAPKPDGFRGRSLLRPDGQLVDNGPRILFAESLLFPPEQKTSIQGSEKVIAQRWPPALDRAIAFDLAKDRMETDPMPVQEPPSRFWSLFEALLKRESRETSGAGVEVDPILREQLKAVGYIE